MSDRIKITRDQVKAVENAMRKGTTDQAVPIEHGGKTWQVPVTRVSQALAEHHEHGSASLRLRVRSFQIELEDGAVREFRLMLSRLCDTADTAIKNAIPIGIGVATAFLGAGAADYLRNRK